MRRLTASVSENRIGNYPTVLAREVVLDGDYEVGLSECVIPVPKRSLNFTQPILHNENGVTVGIGYFQVDASEVNSLTDFHVFHGQESERRSLSFQWRTERL